MCNDLLLSATLSKGNFGKSLTYHWKISLFPTQTYHNTSLFRIDKMQFSEFDFNQTMNQTRITKYNFTVTLTVSNWIGFSHTSEIIIHRFLYEYFGDTVESEPLGDGDRAQTTDDAFTIGEKELNSSALNTTEVIVPTFTPTNSRMENHICLISCFFVVFVPQK